MANFLFILHTTADIFESLKLPSDSLLCYKQENVTQHDLNDFMADNAVNISCNYSFCSPKRVA